MRQIWKYPLQVENRQVLELPVGSNILSVQTQNRVPCMWVMVDPSEKELEAVELYTIGTGHSIPDDLELTHIDTYQLDNGALIFHVFKAA